MDGYDVVGLSSAHCDRVTGARVAARDGGTECHLDADLVVDATGRGSRTPRLIEDLGYRRPGEDELAVPVSYSSQLMRVQPGTLAEKLILVGALPDRPTGGGLLRCEHDTWLVTVAGMLDHQPPMDRSGMIQFAEDFAPPPMLAAMRVGEPIGSPARYRYHGSRWRRYDRMRRFPDGLIVLGDALCSFNPVYGQGMSIAAVEAKCLRDCLATGTSNLARRFFAETAKPIRAAWQLALANDLSLQGTPHSAPWSMRLMQRYTDRLLGAAEYDTVVAERFLAVMNLTASPASLLRPSVVGRVSRRRQLTNAANAAAER
jgi:flavin-dependent dehydrogenase